MFWSKAKKNSVIKVVLKKKEKFADANRTAALLTSVLWVTVQQWEAVICWAKQIAKKCS